MNPLIFQGIIELAKELIPDRDKFKKFETEVDKAKIEFDRLVLGTSTTPNVDAFVKILYAVERFATSLFRPVGSALMTGFAMYAHYKGGLGIDPAVLYAMDGAFPGWGLSRHLHKKEEIKRRKIPDIKLVD